MAVNYARKIHGIFLSLLDLQNKGGLDFMASIT